LGIDVGDVDLKLTDVCFDRNYVVFYPDDFAVDVIDAYRDRSKGGTWRKESKC